MRVSVITPCFNACRYLEPMLESVAAQRADGVDVEHIVLDAGSTDGSVELLERHRAGMSRLIREPDRGPADAINKGLALATGDVLAWLNADDLYAPGALRRACEALARKPRAALCFGHCPIIDGAGREIRRPITRFKELWFPLACRPVVQMLNFVSQPAMVFRRRAYEQAGPLRTDLKAAWDYEFLLRLWRQGGAVRAARPALAYFRWTPSSISGQHYERQFREGYEAAVADGGRWAPQIMLHGLVRWGIVTVYHLMARSARAAGG
jgi:glycosyltransferase involved in cell wall biosynthesis